MNINTNYDELQIKTSSDFWNNRVKPNRSQWWHKEQVLRYINRLVSGRDNLVKRGEGLLLLVREKLQNRIFENAISVGCGNGNKEMDLVLNGLVRHFTLFEISEKRIAQGQLMAQQLGITDRVTFRTDDPFQAITEPSYDMVHWNDSLHHMFNVDQAVLWSREILKPQGLFYMDEYVGPNRFQWSQQNLELAQQVRMLLPKKYLRTSSPNLSKYLAKTICRTVGIQETRTYVPRTVTRPDPEVVASLDPSESVDSQSIIPALTRHFPEAEIIYTGGIVYHTALNDLFHNFSENDQYDRALLDSLLLIDELSLRSGRYQSNYAVALAIKP
jgi:2-polyprenyl-3-methyl-5-hydroxy-6-metoxy-1,4-benzoquinol methylase